MRDPSETTWGDIWANFSAEEKLEELVEQGYGGERAELLGDLIAFARTKSEPEKMLAISFLHSWIDEFAERNDVIVQMEQRRGRLPE
jgi:hypothetical protein